MHRLKVLIFLLTALLGACSGTQLLNSLATGRNIDVATNLVYSEAVDGRLDVYAPADARLAPTVIFFHGGRWTDGDKGDYQFAGKALAARGFVVLVPNLRKYPQVRFPGFMEDAASVLKWSQANIRKYGGSPERTFVMGHSSGAHIAAMLALNEQYLKAVGGSRDWIRGMIGLAGPYDFMPITAPDLRDLFGPPEDFEKSQPIYFVDGRNPPLLLMHGENDDTVSVKNTRSLARAVKTAGGPVETVLYLELSHSIIVASLAPTLQGRADVMDSIVDFVARTLDGKAAGGVAGAALAEPPTLPEAQALPAPEPIPQPLLAPESPAEPAPVTP